MNYKQHTHCRVCKSDKLTMYLDLGDLPLTNNLCETAPEKVPLYPLEAMVCENCWLSQLSIVVDHELLFNNYVYRSSISQGYKTHCKQMAKVLKEEYGLTEDSFMIDIAGNDNALLREFVDEIGLKALNIDPAKNLAEVNKKDEDIRMFCTFWGIQAAKHLENTIWPKADLITATNVIAHIDDLHEFFEAIKIVLKLTGVLIIECPYLIPFIENNEFPTLYQEHVSIISISPINMLCKELGLTVMKVEEQDIHCGSVRIHIGYGEQQQSVLDFIEKEIPYRSIKPYLKFAEKSKETISEFRNKIISLDDQWYKIGAFACSAKGNTLLNCANITSSQINFIIDETKEKIGKFSPGTYLEVVSLEILNDYPQDYLIILSWNFADEIKEKCRNVGYKGKFIIPIPNFQIID